MDGTFVYIIATERMGRTLGPCKCGITSAPEARVASLQTGNPNRIKLSAFLGPMSRASAAAVEAEMHHAYRQYRMRGEWFLVDPEIMVDCLADIMTLFFGCPGDPVEHAKRATRLGFYTPRMIAPPK